MRNRLAKLDLAGELVRLRPHRAEDAPAAFAQLAGCDEILRWLVWDGPGSEAELAEYYRQGSLASPASADMRLAIEERSSGTLVGSVSLRFADHPERGDVGYWIGLQHQGRGLGSEALALAAHLAFRHLEAESLYAWVFVGNVASRAVLERNAFTLVRTVPARVVKRGKSVDEWHFVLLRRDWQRLQGGFRVRVEDVAWEAFDEEGELDPAAQPFPGG